MRSALRLGVFAVALTACNAIVGFGELTKIDDSNEGDGGKPTTGSGGKKDGGGEAGSGVVDPGPRCDPTKDFDAPVPIGGPINTSSAHEGSPTLLADELTMIFQRSTSGAAGALLVARRPSLDADFGQPVNITELAQFDTISSNPSATGSGLDLWWGELVGSSRAQIFHASRTTATDIFQGAAAFDVVASSASDNAPFVTTDGAELFFLSNREDGNQHIHRSVRSPGGNYKGPEAVAELDGESGSFEVNVALTVDKLTIYFGSTRGTGGTSDTNIWRAIRPSPDEPFGAPIPIPSLSSSDIDIPNWISPDNCVMYMTRLPNGPGDIYVAKRPK